MEDFDEVYEITTQFADFHKIQSDISKEFGEPLEANIEYRAISPVIIPDDKVETVQKFIDALEDLDDVQNVWPAI